MSKSEHRLAEENEGDPETDAEKAERGARDADLPERLRRIRARIRDGFYDAPEVLREVARRMRERGDV